MYIRNDNIFTIGKIQVNLSCTGSEIVYTMMKTEMDFYSSKNFVI